MPPTSSAPRVHDDDEPPWSKPEAVLVELIADVAVGYAVMCTIATKQVMPERAERFASAKTATEAAIDRLKARIKPKDRRTVYEALVLHGLPSGVAACCAGVLRCEVAALTRHRSRTWDRQ